MKKTLTAVLAALLTAATATAIPAYPGKIKVKQPDGSELTIVKTGDEHHSLTFTADGYALAFNAATGGYEYATVSQGQLAPSGISATEAAHRPADVAARLSELKPIVGQHISQLQRQRAPQRRIRVSDIPTTGHQQSLIILVEFSDRQFSMDNPQQFYADMLNKPGYTNDYGATGSARDFYLASSNGRYQPDFVVAGPVRLARSYSYYGANLTAQGGIDYQIPEFIHDAAAAADELVDYSQFDSDNDGMVDNIYFFYAGYGEADSGSSSTIWPHSANYYTDFEETLVCDGKYINRYACSQELSGIMHKPVGIGTFVHEYGHVLGLADHYNTQNQQAGGPGLWDTMANGSYLNNQHTPPLFSAFEQAELGWLDYTELTTEGADSIIAMPCLADSAMGYRLTVPETDGNEYFVIENRQPKGWDSYLPGHGLLVWHVDMDEQTWRLNKVNDDPNHQRLDLIEADRTPEHDGGDAFPGTKGVTEFSFTAWDGTEAFGFAMVDEQQPQVKFLLSGTAYELPATESITAQPVTGRTARISWEPVTDATAYDVVLRQADEVVSNERVDATVTEQLFDQLQPTTDYEVSITSVMASYSSKPATLNFTTTELLFTEKQVEVLPATDVTATGFTACWNALEGTDAYELNLFRKEMTGRQTEQWDFTNQSDSRPDEWTTTGSRYDNNFFGQAAPSLRLSRDGDHLTVMHGQNPITELSFWYRASNEGNKITVEQLKDGLWTLATDTIVVMAAEPKTVTVGIDDAEQARLVFHKKANYVQIDDVVMEYKVEQLNAVGQWTACRVEAPATTMAISSLTAGTYAYTLTAHGSEGSTLPSAAQEVTVGSEVQAISTVGATLLPTAVYDLQGRPASPQAKGIIIVRRPDGSTMKLIRK